MANRVVTYNIDNRRILLKDSDMKLVNSKPCGNKRIYGYQVP